MKGGKNNKMSIFKRKKANLLDYLDQRIEFMTLQKSKISGPNAKSKYVYLINELQMIFSIIDNSL